MTTVIKRGGKKEPFNPSKIKRSVRAAARDAGIPLFGRMALVREVAKPVIRACRRKESVKASAIRTMVVKRLSRKSKEAAAAWKKYEKRHKKG